MIVSMTVSNFANTCQILTILPANFGTQCITMYQYLLGGWWNTVKFTAKYFYFHKPMSPLRISGTMIPVINSQQKHIRYL